MPLTDYDVTEIRAELQRRAILPKDQKLYTVVYDSTAGRQETTYKVLGIARAAVTLILQNPAFEGVVSVNVAFIDAEEYARLPNEIPGPV